MGSNKQNVAGQENRQHAAERDAGNLEPNWNPE